jgi:methylthioribose-1-phosphate isomerase
MKVNGIPQRTIWVAADGWALEILDQTQLPHRLMTLRLETLADAARAIREMWVRGAPLIGATAAYGVCLALREDNSDAALHHAYQVLYATRPTAVNLRWALDHLVQMIQPLDPVERVQRAYECAAQIAETDVATNYAIGEHGLKILQSLAAQKQPGDPLNILTHCNAGWLATVDWGTALAPIYLAHQAGMPLHVWVDETRPRNQGAGLTAWELQQQGVPHTVIVDNVGGHLMQHGLVDLCLVGSDRTTARGDVCNKIGTYLKALAAYDNQIPFYVALPSSTIDWQTQDGLAEIPIEQRDATEVTQITGRTGSGEVISVKITPVGSQAANYAFDVTPARLVTGLITERGVCSATPQGLRSLFPQCWES